MSYSAFVSIKMPKGGKERTSTDHTGLCFVFWRNMASIRSDRTPGNRGAYEKARLRILKTQTHCGICGKPVDFSYKAPHPLSPTVDHIIPVSLGGHPSDPDNLQLAHRCCNREKSNKMISPVEAENETEVNNRDLPLSLDWTSYRAGS